MYFELWLIICSLLFLILIYNNFFALICIARSSDQNIWLQYNIIR